MRLTMPRVVKVYLTGRLAAGVNAKEVILEMLRRETIKGGLGKVYEYVGPGALSLAVPERQTITNMGAEMGATTSIFPADERVREFLRAQGREEDYFDLLPDEDAEYDEVCTNASYADCAKAALVMRGHHVHEDVSCTLGIASRQIYKQLLRDGYLEMLVDAGVRVLELACGPCCAIGQTPPTNGVAVRTSNRNFRGRAGNPNADIYLVSPETAAATAIRGTFATAEEIMGEEVKILADVTEPEFYGIDDSMLIKPLPAEEAAKIEIKKGPNIRFLPVPEELSKDLRAQRRRQHQYRRHYSRKRGVLKHALEHSAHVAILLHTL